MDNIKQFIKARGTSGEAIAACYLEKQGFKVLQQNYKNKFGEIDIIAKIDITKKPVNNSGESSEDKKHTDLEEMYHFIEVKLRTSDYYGAGREAVTFSKQKTIRNVAKSYLIENNLYEEVNCCFDVIEISGTPDDFDLEFLENCF